MYTGDHFSAGFLHIFTIFGIFGLAPYKLTPNGCREDKRYLICSMLALVLIPGPYCFLLIKQENGRKSLAGSFVILLFVQSAVVAYIASVFHLLLTTICQRSKVMAILDNFVKFDKSCGCSDVTRSDLKRFVYGALAFVVVTVPHVLGSLERYGCETICDILLSLVIFGMNMTRCFFIGLYVVLLDVLKKKFKLLRVKLERMGRRRENFTVAKPKDLSTVQSLYHELWMLSRSFDFFSTMILMQILTGMLSIVANSYVFIAYVIKRNQSAYEFFVCVALIIGEIGKLLAIVCPCVCTKKEALKIPRTLHKIGGSFEDSKIAIFSIQLIHEQVSFTAGGSIEIVEKLLYSIFGVTCTYMVIILQFENVISLSTNNKT